MKLNVSWIEQPPFNKQCNRQIAWLFPSLTLHEKVNKLAIMIMHWLLDNVWHHLDWRKKEHAPLSAFGNAYLPRYKKWGLIIAKFASEISFWNLSIPVLLTGISNQFRNYETWVFTNFLHKVWCLFWRCQSDF